MASKKKPIKGPTGADRYETALQRAIQKAIWLPEGNDKTVYRKNLAPTPIETKPHRPINWNKYAPMNPFDPTLPKDVKDFYLAKNRKKKNGKSKA